MTSALHISTLTFFAVEIFDGLHQEVSGCRGWTAEKGRGRGGDWMGEIASDPAEISHRLLELEKLGFGRGKRAVRSVSSRERWPVFNPSSCLTVSEISGGG